MAIEKVSIKGLSDQERIFLLKELDYDSDGTFVLTKEGEVVIDKYINQPVKINNMIILEGSTLILDNNPLSIASYLEDHPDVKF
jgi:hypothetical protein